MPTRCGTRQPPVRFENVTFARAEGEPVGYAMSFEVGTPGQRVGIVGATGSGKTTIVSLLLRFYDVQRTDHHRWCDIRGGHGSGVAAAAVRPGHAGRHLFSGTIASNVRLGMRNDVGRDRAARARGRSRVDVRRSDAEGLDTPVAERGATLSVGQKQLLSFARALAFNPRVLILDEATSSVDTDTELLIRDALEVVMRGRTTIAIAHRLSTIQDMDRILVMHHGELRESGTHHELLRPAAGSITGCSELQFERYCRVERTGRSYGLRRERTLLLTSSRRGIGR